MKSRNQLLVELFMAKMGRGVQSLPVAPINPDEHTRVLRARLMFEECMETIQKGLGVEAKMPWRDSFDGRVVTGEITYQCERGTSPCLVEIADGLADQLVVILGTAAACGLDLQPIFEIVMENNMRKFRPGHEIDEGGKLIKPPDHMPPTRDIEREIQRQSCEEISK